MSKLSISILTVFTAAFSLAGTELLHAESLDVSEAKSAATSFLLSGESNGMTKAKIRSGQYLTLAADNQDGYYVFNRQDGGIVIVADDDALGRTVLGYTTEGAYDPENLPLGLQGWFSQIAVLMDAVHAGKIDRSESLSTQQGTIVVDALTKTKWNQYSPYNDLCPIVNGRRCVTGCSATALAQMLKYWEWPAHGYGSVEYTAENINKTLSIDLSKNYYDWSNMPNEYKSEWIGQKQVFNYSDRQANEVAALMRDCGYSVHMNYGLDGSSGSVMASTLIDYFKYSPLCEDIYRSNFSETEWREMLKTDLNNKRPILYCGFTENNGGHEFILDGYDTEDYFHVNWGWGGSQDGWFIITDLKGYNVDQRAIIGVEPITKVLPDYKDTDFSYTLSNGVLTINGAGSMPKEYTMETAPWRNRCQEINKIIIGKGILNTASNFGSYYIPEENKEYRFDNLEEVVLPEGMLTIERNFIVNVPLKRINLPSTLQKINGGFWYCWKLQSLHLPKSLKKFESAGLSGLTELTVDAASPYFTVKDNILFNKEQTKMILSFEAVTRLTIPESVTEITSYAIDNNKTSFIIARPMVAPTLPSRGFNVNQSGLLYTKAGATGYDEWLSKLPGGWKIKTYTDESKIPTGEFSWTLDEGILTISGIGNMPYGYDNRPFADKSSEIRKIKIEEGVMDTGWATFWGFSNTTEIELPSTMRTAESQAFGFSGITRIVCLAKTAPQLNSDFKSMKESGILQVLEGCDYSSWLKALPSGWTIEYIKHPLVGKISKLTNYILEVSTDDVNAKELDANKDGKVTVSDVTEMVRILNE